MAAAAVAAVRPQILVRLATIQHSAPLLVAAVLEVAPTGRRVRRVERLREGIRISPAVWVAVAHPARLVMYKGGMVDRAHLEVEVRVAATTLALTARQILVREGVAGGLRLMETLRQGVVRVAMSKN